MKITATIELNLDNDAFQGVRAYPETRRVLENLESILAHAAQDAVNGITSPKGGTFRDVNGNPIGGLSIEIDPEG